MSLLTLHSFPTANCLTAFTYILAYRYIFPYSYKDLLLKQNTLFRFKTMKTPINFLLVDFILGHSNALIITIFSYKKTNCNFVDHQRTFHSD